MKSKPVYFSIVYLLVFSFLFILSGCFSINSLSMPPKQATNISPSEGIIVGSFKINNRAKWFIGVKGPYQEKGKDVLGKIIYKPIDVSPFALGTKKSLKEVPFVAKLQAGTYLFKKVARNFGGGLETFDVNYKFEVIPQKTIYIGQLNAVLKRPTTIWQQTLIHQDHNEIVLGTGSFTINIVNNFNNTIKALSESYNIKEEDVTIKLIQPKNASLLQ